MRKASASMITLLSTQLQLEVATVVTIVPTTGSIVRLTDADVAITVVSFYDNLSHTFPTTNGALKVGASKLAVGLQTDKLSLTVATALTMLFNGTPWPAAVQQGLLDNAVVLVEKVLAVDLTNPTAGTLILFSGQVSDATVQRYEVQLQLAGWLETVLAQNFPRNVYQTQCLNTLFDSGCTLVRATFAVAGTAQANSAATSIVTGLANPTGYFALGVITFTAGVLIGQTRTVKTYVAGVAYPMMPFSAAPAVGDAFTIYPGCDKLQATCSGKFANLANFRGYPFLPAPENAL